MRKPDTKGEKLQNFLRQKLVDLYLYQDEKGKIELNQLRIMFKEILDFIEKNIR